MFKDLFYLLKNGFSVKEYFILKKLEKEGTALNDIFVNNVIKTHFQEYFKKEDVSDFLFEEMELSDVLNNNASEILDVVSKKLCLPCSKFISTDVSSNFSGFAKLSDGTDTYVCIITCGIGDKDSKCIASSIICVRFRDKEMQEPIDSLCAFIGNGKIVRGKLEDILN